MQYLSFRHCLPAALLLLKVTASNSASPPSGAHKAASRSAATQAFVLKGQLKGRASMIYLSYKDAGKFTRDSAVITNGQFIFRGALTRPVSATLYPKSQGGRYESRSIYLDPGTMTVQTNSSLDSATVTGSPSTYLKDEWNRISRTYLKQLETLRTKIWYLRASRDSVRILQQQITRTRREMEQALTTFVAEHPDSWVSWDLVDERRVGMEPETFKPSFDALSEKFKSSPDGKKLVEQIANVKQAEIGVRSPDFSQLDDHGSAVTLRSMRGKYVLIDFWASWCGICRLENPNVLRAYDAYRDSGFTVLGVSLDDSKEKWLKAVAEDHMPWQQVCDLKGTKNDVAIQYGIIGIPQNVLLDPNGVIIAKNLRDRDLMNKLMEIFDAGRNMRVEGRIDGLEDKQLVIKYYSNNKLKTDTVAVNDGHFTWLTTIPEPEKVQATLLPGNRPFQFYADNGYLQLTGRADSLDHIKVKGSWLDEEAKYASAKITTDQQKEQYIQSHPMSLLSLNLVYDMAMSGANYGKVYPLYMSLSDVVRGMPTARRIAATLSQMQKN